VFVIERGVLEFWDGRFSRDVYSMLGLMCGRWAGFGRGIYNDHFDTFFKSSMELVGMGYAFVV
jgi:hypothetical protein